jgi:hypothetical protein
VRAAYPGLERVLLLEMLLKTKAEEFRRCMVGTGSSLKVKRKNLLDWHILKPQLLADRLKDRPADQFKDSAKHTVLAMFSDMRGAGYKMAAQQAKFMLKEDTIKKGREMFVKHFFSAMRHYITEQHEAAYTKLVAGKHKPLLKAARATIMSLAFEACGMADNFQSSATAATADTVANDASAAVDLAALAAATARRQSDVAACESFLKVLNTSLM